MLNRFTERARRVLNLAHQEAINFGHDFVGTEHILLGLVSEGEGIAAKVLNSIGIDLAKIRAEVEKIIGKREAKINEITYTPRTKKVIESAMFEAAHLGHNYVGTEHLLLGLINEGEGVAAHVLTALGASSEIVRQKVMELLGGMVFTSNGFEQKPISKKGFPNTPLLNEYGRNLNKFASESKIDPVVGREKEIDRVVQILSRRTKNNPVLIGEPGVGKTAVAEGLAQKIVDGNIPDMLKDKIIFSLDLPGMVAGTKYRGEFEERLKKILNEINNTGNIIIFIDELHTLIGAGGAEGAIDAANILKPALARGEIQVIGATTLNEYKKYIEKDAALERRFQSVMIGEPSVEDSLQILKGLRDKYEAFHSVKITDEALKAAIDLSHRYISDRFLPDKAIDLMDEAASRVRLDNFSTPPSVKDIEEKLEKIKREKEGAIAAQEFEQAAKLRDEEQLLRQELDQKQKEWKNKGSVSIVVTEEDIAKVVSAWTGVPVSKIAEEESQKLLKLEEELHNRVIGQNAAVTAVSRAIRRARAGLKDPKRPIGSFMFLGPTGVGKTELARSLAEALFGDENSMIRLDMSEFMEKHTVSKLIGAPPGYVGYDEAGQLTEKVRRKPFSVLLLDEIEKAHPDVFNILLQLLDDGRLTDSQGRTVDFKNTVIIMTSNVGSKHLKTDSGKLGFVLDEKKANNDAKSKVLDDVKKAFRPEFLNRVDELIVFDSLTNEDLKKIVDIMLKDIVKQLKENNIGIEVKDKAKMFLLKNGSDFAYGARPLKRAIQKYIQDEIADLLLRKEILPGSKILVDKGNDEKLKFNISEVSR